MRNSSKKKTGDINGEPIIKGCECHTKDFVLYCIGEFNVVKSTGSSSVFAPLSGYVPLSKLRSLSVDPMSFLKMRLLIDLYCRVIQFKLST